MLVYSFIIFSHLCLHLCDFLWCRHIAGTCFFVGIIPGEGYEVCRGVDASGLQVYKAGTQYVVSLPATCAPHIALSVVISSNDASCLPEPYVVKEFTTRESCLANDQLIDVVGG